MQTLYKNVASQKVIVFCYNKLTGDAATGRAATITANISKDAAAPAATNDVNPTEIGGGLYAFDMTQAETNADLIALYAADSDANYKADPVVVTTGSATPDVNVAQISGDATAADNLELMFDNTGFNASASRIGDISTTGVDGYSVVEALRVIGAWAVGRASGATYTSGIITFGSMSGALPRVVMTVDSQGNRSSITITPSGGVAMP